MLKVAVKVNIGKHDSYREDEYKNSGWDFITFTDLKEDDYRSWSGDKTSEVLQIQDIFFPVKNLSNKKKSGYLGINSLNVLSDIYGVEYDMAIWLSGNSCLIGDLDDFVNQAHKKEVSAPIHTDCRNAIDDASKIISYKKDSEANIVHSLKIMTDFGFKYENGYHETCGLIQSRTEYAHKLAEIWSSEYLLMPTVRDQLVFPFARKIVSESMGCSFYGYDKKLMNGVFK
jgi:hypothetical protein